MLICMGLSFNLSLKFSFFLFLFAVTGYPQLFPPCVYILARARGYLFISPGGLVVTPQCY